MKTETKNTLLAYEQPESYEIKVNVRRTLCISEPYGAEGAAGGDGNVIGGPDDEY